MGLSVTAAATIIFIASIISVATISGAFFDAEAEVQEAKTVADAMHADAAGTHLSLIGVDKFNGSLTLMNVGSTVLDPRDVMVLVNGSMLSPAAVSYEVDGISSTILFNPGETIEIWTGGTFIDARLCIALPGGPAVFAG